MWCSLVFNLKQWLICFAACSKALQRWDSCSELYRYRYT
uniref:Uncharacterized protein n=1 Tax=Anguilla anguilla TaxID=7936 RepID=A0A0E9U7W7_ANGAN